MAPERRELKLPTRFGKKRPGTSPGVLPENVAKQTPPPEPRDVKVTVIDWSPEKVERQGVLDFDAFLKTHRPDWTEVRWINIDGLCDLKAIEAIAKKYELHPLAVLLALMVGGELMGVLGAVLAVPVTAAVSVIVDEIRSERLAPSVDAEDVVSGDLLPKEGVQAAPAERAGVLEERSDVEQQDALSDRPRRLG